MQQAILGVYPGMPQQPYFPSSLSKGYDINNPLHYIVANNPTAVNELIAVKYNLVPPGHPGETLEAAEYALQLYGEQFARDLARIHPDKDAILKETGHLGNCCGKSYFLTDISDPRTLEQLLAEKARIEEQLSTQHLSSDVMSRLIDELEKIKTAIILKQKKQPTSETDKMQKYLLYIIAAVAIMWAGSKLFGK